MKLLQLFVCGLATFLPLTAFSQSTPPVPPLVWYKGDAGLTTTSNSIVTSWQDSSSSASRHLNQVVGSPAKMDINGLPGNFVHFSGNDALWIAGSELKFSVTRSIVIYARVNASSDGFLFDGSSTSTTDVSNPGLTRAQIRNNQWQVGLQGSTGANNADTVTTAVTTGIWQTHTFTYERYQVSGSNYDFIVKHYIDGSLVATHNDPDDVVMQGFILAANISGTQNLNVDVAEVLMYGGLSTTDISNLHSYLSGKWGQIAEANMSHLGATAEQAASTTLPTGGTYELIKLRIDTLGSPNPFKVTNITFDLQGTTNTNHIKSLKVFAGDSSRNFTRTPDATITSGFDSPISTSLNQTLKPGANYIWVAAELKQDLSLGETFDARVTSYTITGPNAGTHIPTTTSPTGALTVGDGSFSTIIRKGGDDGSGNFRIPALVTTNAGTIIAGFDVRWNGNDISSPDLPADMDTAIMRSTDGGLTWSPMQIIMDFDKNEANSLGNGVGDPSLLVDRTNGRIWCAALWSKGNRGWNGSGSGFTPSETGQFMLCYSDDDGITWSTPSSITSQIKDFSWNLYFQGPGKGICTRNGILVFPAQYRDSSGTPRSNFIYSSDQGSTWHTAAPAIASGSPWTTESQIVELDNGDLLISMRNHDSSKRRLWNIYSWNHSTQTIADGSWGTPWFDLTDPTVMGSVERYSSTLDGEPSSILLFANPNSTTRSKMTVRASLDEGASWTYTRKIDDLLAAYSCMTRLPDGDIGILYETGASSSIATLKFMRFPLSWLVGDTDTDSDGMSDFYEDTNGLNKNDNSDASGDLDNDGITNLQEALANTSSLRTSSQLAVSQVSRVSNNTQIDWLSVPFKNYTIEESTTLTSGSWVPVPNMNSIRAKSSHSSILIPTEVTDPHKFYRVKAQ